MSNTFINQHNLTQSIFNAGNAGAVQNLAGRVPNVQSLLNGNASLAGAQNTINTIPGIGSALNSLQNNPLGALTQFSGLNLQAGLPSLASITGAGAGASGLGTNNASTGGANPLNAAFNLASSAAGSNIPSSVTGAVQLALQVKAIVCNLKIPNITAPDISKLLKANFTSLEKQVGQLLLHEIQVIVDELFDPIKKIIDELSDFFSPEKIKKLLASIIPDVNDLIKNTVNQFTKCNNGPAAKKNDLSGKDPTGTAPDAPAGSGAPEGPSAGQSALDSGAASNPAATSTSNADSFLANSSGLKTTPAAGGTETDYNAKGDVVSSKSFDASGNTTSTSGPAPAPGTVSAPPSIAPSQTSRTPVWSAGSQAQIDALNSGKLK